MNFFAQLFVKWPHFLKNDFMNLNLASEYLLEKVIPDRVSCSLKWKKWGEKNLLI